MRSLLFITLLGLSLQLCVSQYLTAVSFCPNGVKAVADGCYMTTSEAEGNVMTKCSVQSSYEAGQIKLLNYNFKDIDSCTNFRTNFLASFTNTFNQAQTSAVQNNDTTSVQTVQNASCGCIDVVEKIIDQFIEADSTDSICDAIVDKKLDKIGDICPSSVNALKNFFFSKACDFVTDKAKALIDKAFVRPICLQINNVISEALKVNLATIKTSPSQIKDKVSQLVCAALFCKQKDSRTCKTPSFTPGGAWSNALSLIGVCPKADAGSSASATMTSLSVMAIATPIIMLAAI